MQVRKSKPNPRREMGLPTITQLDILQARVYINENNSYPVEEQHKDDFFRRLLRAATVDNTVLFKEMMEVSQEYGYDYKNLFKNKDKLNHSLLHVACQNGRPHMIKLLLTEYGFADELNNTDNKDQMSAFILAVLSFVSNGRPIEKMQLMLDMGADILQVSKGYTVLDILNSLNIDNECSQLLRREYHAKLQERNRLLALFLLLKSDVSTSHPMIKGLKYHQRLEIVDLL